MWETGCVVSKLDLNITIIVKKKIIFFFPGFIKHRIIFVLEVF